MQERARIPNPVNTCQHLLDSFKTLALGHIFHVLMFVGILTLKDYH